MFTSAFELAVLRNRLRLTDLETGRTLERAATYPFSTSRMLIANRECFEQEFKTLLTETGFTGVDIEPTRIYRVDDAREFLKSAGLDVDLVAREIDGRFMGAFVRGNKPN